MKTFTEAVHEATRQIPKGETRSYKEIAVAIGHPKAYRAVANVLKQNYDPSIPCHRVIRSDGTLGGYNRGGTEAKLKIIDQEMEFCKLESGIRRNTDSADTLKHLSKHLLTN